MITHILILHGQLPFAITLKQSLERGAPFEAHPFTSVDAAVEYLRDHIQDVALVDFSIPDYSGDQIVQLLREVQSDIVIIATPRQPDDVLRALDLQGSLSSGFAARDLISVIDAYFADNQRPTYIPPKPTGLLGRVQPSKRPELANLPNTLPESLPPTAPLPPSAGMASPAPEYSTLDDILASSGSNLFGEPPEDEEGTNQFGSLEDEDGDTPSGEDFAWASQPQHSDSTFDEVLNSLPSDAPEGEAPRNPFTDLVNSMRSGEAHRPLPSRQEQFVEFILTGGMDSLLDEIEQSHGTGELPELTSESLFERLAQEEPPPPTFEESGTVADLVTGVQDRSFRNVLSILRGEEVEESEPVIPPPSAADFDVGARDRPDPIPGATEQYFFDDEPTPARVILQRTLEESVSGSEFSIEELLQSIEHQFPQSRPRILPMPSWLQQPQEDAFMVHEPDFLPEELPPNLPEGFPIEATPSSELYPNQITQPSRGQVIEEHPEALETEWLQSAEPEALAEDTATFPTTLPEEFPADDTMIHQPLALEATDEWHNLPEQDFNTQFEMMAAFEVHDEDGVSSGALYTEVPLENDEASPEVIVEESEPDPEPMSDEDAYVAQLALSLTEVSLELTAEATLLARNGEIVAYAGRMPKQEIDELRGTISDDWNAAPGEVRIRFLTAKGSGKDYMLYSRRTEDDFTLSLIFAGTTPLRDIRRQGKRLVESLLAVPDHAAAARVSPRTQPHAAVTEASAAEDTSVRAPYTCVWLLRDPHSALDPAVAQAIIAGLNVQMQEKGWHIQSLQVRDDYVYLFADVPGDDPAFQIVRDLKRRSAEIAHAQNAAYAPRTLWSDGYLVVTPGRELDAEEIQQFITFERMG